MIPGHVAVQTPGGDPLALLAKAKLKEQLDALTDELLADYIRNHLLSRGAPVGRA